MENYPVYLTAISDARNSKIWIVLKTNKKNLFKNVEKTFWIERSGSYAKDGTLYGVV